MAFDSHANLVSGTVLIPPTPALSGEIFVVEPEQGMRFTPGTPVTLHRPAIEPSLSTAEIGMRAPALRHLVHSYEEAGLNARLPRLLHDLATRAVAEGYGADGWSRVFDLFRTGESVHRV